MTRKHAAELSRTKIIATLGPASSDEKTIGKLIGEGVNVFRFNFSHGEWPTHAAWMKRVRKQAKLLKKPVGILADLPGPKIRTGKLKDGKPIYLVAGQTCILTTEKITGHDNVIPVALQSLPDIVKAKDRILLADGILELRVKSVQGQHITCQVVVGGELRDHKGINLPGHPLPVSSLTPKDQKIVRFIADEKLDVDFLALSFVQSKKDVTKAKRLLNTLGLNIPIISKIEKPQAVDSIDDILEVTDGIMIARGDLGVEIPTARVPVVQKDLIIRANAFGKPVITATQMLDSMITNPRPTRAETTDVANAIWDGTDAVMLSNETATGQYPVQTVSTMRAIVREADQADRYQNRSTSLEKIGQMRSIFAAVRVLSDPDVYAGIVVYTESGTTAIALSKLRPQLPIFAVTPSKRTLHRLTLAWGVTTVQASKGKTFPELLANGDKALMSHTALKKGQKIVLLAGTRLHTGATNLIKVHGLGSKD